MVNSQGSLALGSAVDGNCWRQDGRSGRSSGCSDLDAGKRAEANTEVIARRSAGSIPFWVRPDATRRRPEGAACAMMSPWVRGPNPETTKVFER